MWGDGTTFLINDQFTYPVAQHLGSTPHHHQPVLPRLTTMDGSVACFQIEYRMRIILPKYHIK